MAATTKITSGAGLRRIQVFALDTNGYPNGDQVTLTVGYDGEYMAGARAFNLTIPGVRTVQHVGDDRLQAQDYLPPTEGAGGEILTNRMNLDLDSILTATNVTEVGETQMGAMLTNEQGSEIDVAIVGYRQALDTNPGSQQVRRWQAHMFPIARMIPKGASIAEGGADENGYDIVPTVVTAPPWGHAFSEAHEGYTEAQYLRFNGEYPPILERWTGNGTLDTITLTHTPISVAKTAVFGDGVALTVLSVDTSAKTATLSAVPNNGVKVVAWYETSDDI